MLVLFIATVGGFAFSFISGFTVGRFTALLPLLVTAYAVTYGRARLLQLTAYAAGVTLYIVLAWVIPERVGYWGIHIELPLSPIAYGIAFLRPPADPSERVRPPMTNS